MCHPVIHEARSLASCTRRDFQDFRRRWAGLFEACGLEEIVRAATRYSFEFVDDPEGDARLAAVLEELLLGFGLSLLAAVSEECPHLPARA